MPVNTEIPVNIKMSEDSPVKANSLSQKPDGINGSRLLITWAAFVVTVPLLVVIGVIVYILICYNVTRKADSEPSLRLPSDPARFRCLFRTYRFGEICHHLEFCQYGCGPTAGVRHDPTVLSTWPRC